MSLVQQAPAPVETECLAFTLTCRNFKLILAACTILLCLPILAILWHLTCHKVKKEKSTAVSAELGLSEGQKKGWFGNMGGAGGWKWWFVKRKAKSVGVMAGF